MSQDGAFVYFESPIALAPGALNDAPVTGESVKYAENVYEYHDGHVYLISDGKDTTGQGGNSEALSHAATELLGTDNSGADVFFTTFDPLVPGDTDTQRDIYDARIEGGNPAPVAVSSCAGETCQGAPGSAPVFAAPGSTALVAGAGNLTPPAPATAKPKTAAQIRAAKLALALKLCRKKHNKHNRAVCEKQARKTYAAASKAKKAKKSARGSRDRRATR